jgi:hypothetical protein
MMPWQYDEEDEDNVVSHAMKKSRLSRESDAEVPLETNDEAGDEVEEGHKAGDEVE